MREIRVRFERDPKLDRTEILIRGPEEDERVTALLAQLTGERTDTLLVHDEEGSVHSIRTEDIILASVMGKLVNVVTQDGSWRTRRTLQSLEDTLDARRFLRVSRYELVNLDKVVRYDFTVAGTLRLELAGGMETWASRRCIPAIRKRLTGKE